MAVAIIFSVVLGCSHEAAKQKRIEDVESQQKQITDLANAYFRLGSSIAALVILEHEKNGTPVPTGATFLVEVREYDRTHGGEKDKMLHPF